jgi:DNA repair exonuclease SbcCD ATPase subunit
MEQITMEQLAELLKVQIGGLASRMDADKAESKAEREADKAEMKASQEELMAKMDANERKMDSNQERTDANLKAMKADQREMKAELKAWLGEMGASRESTEACEEKTKALPETTEACPMKTRACLEEETGAVVESLEVPEGATYEETSGGTEDRTGEQRLAVRRHRQRKKRAQVNGGPRQKFAAARGRFTRRAVPAMRKGHVRRGPGMKYRRSGIRGRGKAFGSRMEHFGRVRPSFRDSLYNSNLGPSFFQAPILSSPASG